MEKSITEPISSQDRAQAVSTLSAPQNHVEGFHFSFNDIKQEKHSIEPSPSPYNENLVEKLTSLKSQMEVITSKINDTNEKVAAKQQKNLELKSRLEMKKENKINCDESMQACCVCKQECGII